MSRCPWCRTPFKVRRHDQVFCSKTCNAEARKLELKRAVAVYRALYWWRLCRKTGAADLLFVCREIASWILEDRLSQRLPPPRHNHQLDRGHQRRKAA